ncbi:MAG: hypothetical protein EBR84_03520, partial [Actinobacteria bacterium]|nr:hypothetical protein [Actinomycetota bacterium]
MAAAIHPLPLAIWAAFERMNGSDGVKAMDQLSGTLKQTQDTMITALPDLSRFLQDSREVAAQLKLAAIEVR